MSAPRTRCFRIVLGLWLGLAVLHSRASVSWGRTLESVPEGRWAILVAGISGDRDLAKEFSRELKDLYTVLTDSLGFAKDRIFVLAEDPASDPGLVGYQSTRESLQSVCRNIAGQARAEDLVFVFITGHGSFDGKTYKLNLVGPDPTAEDLAAALFSIPAGEFVVVNATTSSGASLEALSRKQVVVITATRSGAERNRTHLGGYFAEALENNRADADKNGRVSMLEAFAYAAQKVEEFYSKESILQTEHPVLDDNGDAQAHPKPAPENGDGLLARTTYLNAATGPSAGGSMSPEQEQLSREARLLEIEIEALKYAKAGMPEEEYEKKLEALLLKLAAINAKLRRR